MLSWNTGIRTKCKRYKSVNNPDVKQAQFLDYVEPMHRCVHCSESKPYAAFHRNPQAKSGLQSWCKDCNRTFAKGSHRNLSPEKRTIKMQRQRKYYLIDNYGISHEEYDRLLDVQNGVCAICKQEETKFNKRTNRLYPLAVDHNHVTGKVRGLLCFRCNVAYGNLKEDPERIKALLDYHYRTHGEENGS